MTRDRSKSSRALSAREYAAHRKAAGKTGTTHQAVLKAIRSGRLVASIRRVDGGWAIDPELADREWNQATDPAQVRQGPATDAGVAKAVEQRTLFGTPKDERADQRTATTLGEQTARARAARESVAARLANLRLEELQGKLVRRDHVERRGFALARDVRNALLAIPPRLAPELAAITDPRDLEDLLRRELENALAKLSREFAAPAEGVKHGTSS